MTMEKGEPLRRTHAALLESIQATVKAFDEGARGNVAVLVPPFSSFAVMPRDLHSSKGLSISRTVLSGFPDGEPLDDVNGSIAILEGCHHLYRMSIGGFAVLRKFLRDIEEDDGRLFITVWNANAWKYLDQAIGLGAHFPVQLRMPELCQNELRDIIMEKYDEGEIDFQYDDMPTKEPIVEWLPHEYRFMGKDREALLPRLDGNALRRALLRRKVYLSAEEKVFSQIHYLSKGNLGAAQEIWIRSLDYPVIRPSYVLNACKRFMMDNGEAFVAANILRKGKVSMEEMREDIGDQVPLDLIVSNLRNKGIVNSDGSVLKIRAENLSFTLDSLAKHGMV